MGGSQGTARIAAARSGAVLAERARWARTARDRRRGLLGTAGLEVGEGLIIGRGFQIHTFGMRYPIDVVFCTKDWRVKHVARAFPPNRVSRIVIGARWAVELPAGTVDETLAAGDRLQVD